MENTDQAREVRSIGDGMTGTLPCMSGAERDDPSLLRFVMERLDEEEVVIIRNTPVADEDMGDAAFRERFLDRGALIGRSRLDREVVVACIETLRDVQGPAPVPMPKGPVEPSVALGSRIIKLVASRFSDHADYREHWRPEP
jgi:hypothetical protein